MATHEFTNNIKRQLQERGYRLHSLYHTSALVAISENPESMQPFAVYSIDGGGKLHSKSNLSSYQEAVAELDARVLPKNGKAAFAERVRWSANLETHRVGRWKEWLIVQTLEDKCYALPYHRDFNNIENIHELSHLLTTYHVEAMADTLNNLIMMLKN